MVSCQKKQLSQTNKQKTPKQPPQQQKQNNKTLTALMKRKLLAIASGGIWKDFFFSFWIREGTG